MYICQACQALNKKPTKVRPDSVSVLDLVGRCLCETKYQHCLVQLSQNLSTLSNLFIYLQKSQLVTRAAVQISLGIPALRYANIQGIQCKSIFLIILLYGASTKMYIMESLPSERTGSDTDPGRWVWVLWIQLC